MTLWQGRLDEPLDPLAARLNTSLPFDRRLADEEIRVDIAWAQALARAGVITADELGPIVRGLEQVGAELASGEFVFAETDEDVHTAVERRLGELIGRLAGKLHTGRSRNDLVVTDLRLWTLASAGRIAALLKQLQGTLLERAERDWGVVLPGYTHLRPAQPILLSHWWLAHFWAFERDRDRLRDLCRRTRVMPLGSGALAGTTVAIDRWQLAHALGFESPSANSVDAVSDRDFVAEFLFSCTVIALHLSRLAEALILYSTEEFDFLELPDRYCTGSSLMPQKKNPDVLELIRARAGAMLGGLTGWLATARGLPSAYDKDLQEDKPPLFAAADALELMLPVMSGVVEGLAIHPEQMRQAIPAHALATELADYLVSKGVPFRQAREQVARAVRHASRLGVGLDELPLEQWKEINPKFEQDLIERFDVELSLARRSAWGGTSPDAVREQMLLARRTLNGDSEG